MKLQTRQFKNKKISNVIRRATRFYLESLGVSLSNINILIVLKSLRGADGTCEKKTSKNYIIELNDDLQLEHGLITLAHEVVHIKQYINNQLDTIFVDNDTVDIWEGKRYRNSQHCQQPWEVEAMLLEEQLYINFVSECYATGVPLHYNY